jgi:homoserine dehydrogenase
MKARITPHDVDRTGIDADTGAAARAALAAGKRLRLVASAGWTAEGRISATVKPVALAEDDLLAGVRGTANALVLWTDLLGEMAICQLSGDLTQTAYALLSDLITIRRRQGPHEVSARRSL